ncbi:hypothetical protein FSP39_018199 [Pinctada imbricata]|uniref:Origin recognition complex subunit 5 n=1 Tax=Pinctada imbricata TaxID=66713 RepID=A0AA88YLL0_PINIB|nr:hypothetical protein FSP39_018199 [Pinctada imbricata]
MAVPSIFIYGHTGTGKSMVVNTVFQTLGLPHVLINCIECYSSRFLYETILNHFHGSISYHSDPGSLMKCDNMNDFVRMFRQVSEERGLNEETVYIVLDKAERLREMDANILPALLRLQELVSLLILPAVLRLQELVSLWSDFNRSAIRLQELTNQNVCVILLTEIVWEKFRTGTGYCEPLVLHFPDYNRDELIEIMSGSPPTGYSEDFYRTYLNLVLGVFQLVCRDLIELQHLATINFRKYTEPLESLGPDEIPDARKLWKNVEPHLKKALQTVYLREISSLQWEKMQESNESNQLPLPQGYSSRTSVELPYYSKFLLIAAYLTSYNPAKSDKRFFVKHSGKAKKSKIERKHERTSNHMLGPKPFPMDRLLAIFYSICEGKVAPTANIFMQMLRYFGILHILAVCVAYKPSVGPFFFLCNYHGNVNELGIDKGEVAVGVSIEGNPDTYVPGNFYNVTVTSSLNFDGFFLTGLYTLTSEALANLRNQGFYGNSLNGQSLMCSMVHHHISLQPQHKLSFLWLAPPSGTGCVSFLATATLGQQLLFKDTTVLQMCEAGGSPSSPLRPELATVHNDGVILRDDFDSSDNFSPSIWMLTSGVNISNNCGTVMYGDSALFCESQGERRLVTVPLNTTAAIVLQFALSSGSCSSKSNDDQNITVSLGLNSCSDWLKIDTVIPPEPGRSEVHLVHLPPWGRGEGICIQWQQISRNYVETTPTTTPTTTITTTPKPTTTTVYVPIFIPNDQPMIDNIQNDQSQAAFDGCWAIDNVLVANMAHPPTVLEENFDPVDPGKWLFFPGANIRHKCLSEENSMYFNLANQSHNYVVSRDLDLSPADVMDDVMLEEQFESKFQPGWQITGGRVDVVCGILYQANSMIFDGAGERKACTPYMDTRTAGNLRFYFGFGSGACRVTETEKVKVSLYLENKKGHSYVLRELGYKGFKEPQLISIPINGYQRQTWSRICWLQKYHTGLNKDVWAIDGVQVLPHFPQRLEENKNKVSQFSLNLQCGNDAKKNSVTLEYSTDQGRSWYPLHEPCLPGNCLGKHQPVRSKFESPDFRSWKRVTQPLPYAAMVPTVRFRWIQEEGTKSPNWAVDDVFIGDCKDGCSGHGQCLQTGCKCDFGYSGTTCKQPAVPHPTSMLENFVDQSVMSSSSLMNVRGASLGYDCDVLASGKALVFNAGGPRRLVTTDFNTTNNRYIQFYIRVGSNSVLSKCPPPDRASESVILDYSCNGGLTWDLIKVFSSEDIRDPQADIVMLPAHAKGPACRFRFWQPNHSGPGFDVWAIDGLSLNDQLFNTLNLPMDDYRNNSQEVAVNLGRITDGYCDGRKSMSFIDEKVDGDMRFLMTEPLHIGPTYIMQFDLVMGCNLMYDMTKDNLLYLEYSSDHGLSWSLVQEPCVPPTSCKEYKEGTVYKPWKYTKWTQVTVMLPPSTWGHAIRFRLRQSDWSTTDSWAVSRLYIGQQCPRMCNGHGTCVEGVCQCESGFSGEECKASTPMDSTMQADFGLRYEPEEDFKHIWGGEVTSGQKGCGTLLSGESLYFSMDGTREVQTKDFDTSGADYIQFYMRIGGGLPDCNGGDSREEGVILQYSKDGGITWHTLQEMAPNLYRTPKFVHVVLPKDAKSSITRFRWWQPSHSGGGRDQWALDEVKIGSYERLRKIQDNFNDHADVMDSGMWLIVTEGVRGKYCQARDPALILANQENNKYVITKDLDLEAGDVIQFKINVGCSNQFRLDHPVLLQYSHNGGQTWRLVHEPCYQENDCDGLHTEGTIYYSGPQGSWQTVMIPVSEEVAMHPVMFRWWQPGGYAFSFALNDVYIGPPCPENCHRNGLCHNDRCECLQGFTDVDCDFLGDSPYGLVDWFDNHHEPKDTWKRVMGGKLGLGCGVVDYGNSMYFSGEGIREAVTVPLNTVHLRMLQFMVKIGGNGDAIRCTTPISRNEGIIVDYSTDNEITWNVLKMVEPRIQNETREFVTLELPPGAKTERTIFRFWQPLGYGGMPRAEWGLDSVIIGVNETNVNGFQDDFNSMMPDPQNWLQTESAVPRITCQSNGNALEFSRDKDLRFAETQDFHISPSSFLQFDIAMACDSLYSTLYGVMLEYSVDMGQTWHPVVDQCTPPDFQCSGYHLSSEYMSEQHKNWTRITVYLPPGAVSPATRFRWKQRSDIPRGHVWALDNVYLGNGCPWLCSGHGYCRDGNCVCDAGFSGPLCEPSRPLPMMLRDDFNKDNIDMENWREIYGGETSNICGQIVSGKALTFHEDHMRMIVSRDIDTSMLESVEFYFKYGCNGKVFDWPRSESVLLQYSTNGGITWNLLKEIHYTNHTDSRFFSLDIPMKAKAKATRFRFWQPSNKGKMLSTWAVDNFYIGKMMTNPSMLADDFDTKPLSEAWLFVNDGEIGGFCQHNIRADTRTAGISAMVFRHGPKSGRRYVVTSDLDVGPMSVVQFDINVGCESEPSEKYPIQLEYSANGGKTWHLLVPNCAETSSARCFDVDLHPTLYYGGTTKYWRRIVVPLDNIYICGSLRFRWYQGSVPSDDFAPEWAIDNVFIGMACMDHCLGHGSCSDTMMCTCDPSYHGDSDQIDEEKWQLWSGGVISDQCGNLVAGESLYFNNNGERVLVTKDLNLSKVSTVQFFIQLGCKVAPPEETTFPVYLQYSTNNGITWTSIEQFDFNRGSNSPSYVALHLPEKARTNSTIVRWWQPSLDGTFNDEWAIDQIYVGGDVNGVQPLSDDPMIPRETSWLLYPGGTVEEVCGTPHKAIHFNGDTKVRYAVSADVTVEDNTFVQFDLAMSCSPNKECYEIRIEYSHDFGISWKELQPPCLPSDVDCGRFYPGSTLSSDVHTGWNRVTIPLPYYTKAKAVRLRWTQPSGYGKNQPWAVNHLYIGKDCPDWCNGHGKCSESGCVCDSNWGGTNCSEPIEPLPQYLYEKFDETINSSMWLKVVGGEVKPACHVLGGGNALHFKKDCSRLLISHDLDLRGALFIQFYFLFGCHSFPKSRNQGVLVDFSVDGGSTWMPVTELYYALFQSPRFVTVKLPEAAKKNGVRFRWWQPLHGGKQVGDWTIDNIYIGGAEVNPNSLTSDFDIGINNKEWLRDDNVNVNEYCEEDNVAAGTTLAAEDSVITTRDLNVRENDTLQFEINVGCGQSYNSSTAPVHLQYSTDYGVKWNYLSPQCLPNDPQCNGGPHSATIFYGDPMGMWRRHIFKLFDLPVSRATRFRWFQRADGGNGDTHTWGLRNVYIGPSCTSLCNGHGTCEYPQCLCDPGYTGTDCGRLVMANPTYLKDNFEQPEIDKTKWSVVEGGGLGKSCQNLVEGSAVVMSGPVNRQLVTVDLDLRDAKFVQFIASIGGERNGHGCFIPNSPEHSVILQYSTDGGISWDTLHILDFGSYVHPKRDYIPLPLSARTASTRVRWWQPLTNDGSQRGPQWALDNVYIGGSEINPSQIQVSFDENQPQRDSSWEFNTYSDVQDNICQKGDNSLTWEEGTGVRSFTTKQMIVQDNYMLQFKIVIGCDNHFNVCSPHPSVKLEYNKNPTLDRWDLGQAALSTRSKQANRTASPVITIRPSVYNADGHSSWTLVTIPLNENLFSSTTRFRWSQNATEHEGPSWAIDDIYVGERCPRMCHSRGTCRSGQCFCDRGYFGISCEPQGNTLIRKMFDNFEGGIFRFYWSSILGGEIGFGCGALLPYAHGKTLYFNGCGSREARTVEMDLSYARKVMFVIQIGCRAQTPDCNVKTGSNSQYRGVILQYSKNKGAEWELIARHDPEDYLNPKRAAYDLPNDAQTKGVMFRWWQPVHGGKGHDQWAIDHVEILQ